MAAARNVSAAASRTERPSACVAAGELADRRGLAGPVDPDHEHDRRAARDGRARAPGKVARDEQGRQLGPDRRLGSRRVAILAGTLDEVDRERRPDVAGDQRFLDVVPRRSLAGRGPELAPEACHEAAPGPLQAGVEGGRGVGRDSGGAAGRTVPRPGPVLPRSAPAARAWGRVSGSRSSRRWAAAARTAGAGRPARRAPRARWVRRVRLAPRRHRRDRRNRRGRVPTMGRRSRDRRARRLRVPGSSRFGCVARRASGKVTRPRPDRPDRARRGPVPRRDGG